MCVTRIWSGSPDCLYRRWQISILPRWCSPLLGEHTPCFFNFAVTVSRLLSQNMATATIAPAPNYYNILKAAHATTHTVLPADRPSHLPQLIELSNVQQIALPHWQQVTTADGCQYLVAWCSGPRPSRQRVRLLQRLGKSPLHPAVDRHRSHVHWNASVLH